MRKSEENTKGGQISVIPFTVFCVVGILVSIILVFAFSMMISAEKLPASASEFAVFASAFIGAVSAGFMSSRRLGRVVFTALAQGLFFFCMLYLIGTICFLRILPSGVSISLFLSCILGALIGGLISAGKKKRRR